MNVSSWCEVERRLVRYAQGRQRSHEQLDEASEVTCTTCTPGSNLPAAKCYGCLPMD